MSKSTARAPAAVEAEQSAAGVSAESSPSPDAGAGPAPDLAGRPEPIQHSPPPRHHMRDGRGLVRATYALLFTVAALFTVATIYGIVEARRHSAASQAHTEAALWLAVSFERERDKLESMAWRFVAEDGTLTAEELTTQFDIFWSRVELLSEGELSRPLARIETFAPALEAARTVLRTAEASFFESVEAGRAPPREFLERLQGLRDPIHDFVVDVHLQQSWRDEDSSRRLAATSVTIYATLAVAFIALLILVTLVVAHLRSRQHILGQTLRALAQSEEDRGALGREVILRRRAEEDKQALLSTLQTRNKELAYRANHDALTGLVNRAEFERRLHRALRALDEPGQSGPHALCYIDLDQFKVINDACGHRAGDELLRQLTILLGEQVRQRDTLARLGGDEFGLLLEHCSAEQANRVAEAIRHTVAEYRFLWEHNSFRIGASIGLVPLSSPRLTVAAVLGAADSACYAAKDLGRNRVQIYRAGDETLARRQDEMQWAVQIQRALDEDRFCLFAQPILRLGSSGPSGEHYELLVRMVDENGAFVLPGAFMAAAERYDLAPRIDRWVVGNALGWLARSPERLEHLGLCTINLSGNSLADHAVQAFIVAQLRDSTVPAAKVCFEVTETAAISNLAAAMRFMEALHDLGCSFALDDFGSGLSSFAYLRTLPVEYLKIDGHFVKDIASDEIDLAMVRSIHQIGKVMGKQTVAEFVETAEILEVVRGLGIDFAQGYEIGRPEPVDTARSAERPAPDPLTV